MATTAPMRDIDHEIWRRELNDFVPHNIHDAHVHLFRTVFDAAPTPADRELSASHAERGFADVTMELWQTWNDALFPGRRVSGSCMGFPYLHADLDRMNLFVSDEAHKDPGSVPVMIVKPGMDPQAVSSFIQRHRIVGLKPYRWYSSTGDWDECGITDFLPEALIEVANHHGLMVILHMSKRRAIADPQNMADLTRFNRQYPRVKWQLAHCARCFIPSFLEEAIEDLAGLENIWYDTSAVCESDVFDVLFSRAPRERIMFGSDNLPAGVDRGKYIAFGYAWAAMTETNHSFGLTYCNPTPTWVIYEELRALRRIARRFNFTQSDIEALFHANATRLIASIGR
jgi:hypothetical protein